MVMPDAELYERLRGVLKGDPIPLSDYPDYGGTGAPGRILERLLGVNGGNYDTPDAGRWEIKFHSQNSLLTLFHLEAQPKGHMHYMVREFGWRDEKGRISFRHTIRGRSERGFYVSGDNSRITVRRDSDSGIVWPYWTHDSLINAFASKFRRLIVVKGAKRDNMVNYERAYLYTEPHVTLFVKAIEEGIVAIDFDARTKDGREGLRNHGTKFRIKYNDLSHLYSQHKEFD
ncbi:MAG: MvaI/BcnI family restriction endonuclease [Alphaproteobacteria bacterium]|nr:MvaI/BcnI family restriction endonuclease [Alphaproteobacteria bacterium]